jgi:2-C-methyl-D-erythritol 4-phosphate cytidylyltransferase
MKPLGGKPVFIRMVEQFKKAKNIDEIIVAVRHEEIPRYQKWLKKEGINARLVIGGEQRYVSAYNGVLASRGKYVVIHDGDRPLIPVSLIEKIAEEVKNHPAVILAVETHTCIKKIKDAEVKKCYPRAETWLAQTPQAFRRDIIIKAYEKAIAEKEMVSTDDCDLVNRLGVVSKMVRGDHCNIKITIPADLIIVRELYKFMTKNKTYV